MSWRSSFSNSTLNLTTSSSSEILHFCYLNPWFFFFSCSQRRAVGMELGEGEALGAVKLYKVVFYR